ncbi:Zinc finger C2H2 [Penicillium longicatenatum]|nr:Zinc finger C2H2 [Penicillium longicatenatum]
MRSVKSTIYGGVYRINGGKEYIVISVGNKRAISDEPAREILLVETFFTWPTTDSLEDEWTRRNKAITTRIQYCGFQEGGPLRGRRKRSTPSNIVPSPLARRIKTNTLPTTSWDKGYTSGEKNIPNIEVRRHFRTLHLTDRKCNFCDLSVLHEMHLWRHTEGVYSLRT